jgi:hypothetical protein
MPQIHVKHLNAYLLHLFDVEWNWMTSQKILTLRNLQGAGVGDCKSISTPGKPNSLIRPSLQDPIIEI